MIKLDLTNAISKLSFNKYLDSVKTISENMDKFEVEGFKFLGWKDLPENYNKLEIQKIKQCVKQLKKEDVDTLVVIGIGGSFAGAKAAIDMINGEYPTNVDGMKIIYAGESMSSTNLAQKLLYVQDKNFAINIISKSGTTTEPAIAFRLFKKIIEDKVGLNNASKFIFATTDSSKGTLFKIAEKKGYQKFVIPNNIGGRFSVLTPVGLFPMACANIDIDKVLEGALFANNKYKNSELEENDAYKYAVARIILGKNYPIELMVQYETQMKSFNEWWKQLAGESEGKDKKGVFPASSVFSTDLHSLGQFIQEGSKILYETVITVNNPNKDVSIIMDKDNLDNLNYLFEKTVHEVNQIAFEAITDAHVKVAKVPNIHIEIDKMNAFTFGELVIFFQRAVSMTAYLMHVNPFNQPGVEVYKYNMFKRLDKPE